MYMHDHKPDGFNYNVSVMDPQSHWQVLTTAIILGGHVRVGMEDNPYQSENLMAESNVELVENLRSHVTSAYEPNDQLGHVIEGLKDLCFVGSGIVKQCNIRYPGIRLRSQ